MRNLSNTLLSFLFVFLPHPDKFKFFGQGFVYSYQSFYYILEQYLIKWHRERLLVLDIGIDEWFQKELMRRDPNYKTWRDGMDVYRSRQADYDRINLENTPKDSPFYFALNGEGLDLK